MKSDYEAALVHKRDEIFAEIERLRKESADIASRLTVKEAQVRNIDDLLSIEAGQRSPAPTLSIDGSQPTDRRTSSLADQAADVLRDLGKPIHYRQLVGLLAEGGFYVPGKDPGANLIAHVSRDSRFVRTGRGMYALTEWPSATVMAKGNSRKTRARKRAR